MARIRSLVVAALAASALVPVTAEAATVRTSFQLVQLTPSRVWQETSFVPFALPDPVNRVYRYRLGSRTFVGPWYPASVSTLTATEALARLRKDASVGSGTQGTLVDRPLTAPEKRRFAVLAELYRDADVLVVTAGHPACAGISRAQARSIATGRITRWSQVVASAPVNAIRVHHRLNASGDAVPHLGTKWVGRLNRWRVNYAPGARGSADGGVARAASGDASVAAITTWARLRGTPPGVCAVPLNGVAPSDETVQSLRYPEAFPVSYVVTRAVPGRSAEGRAQVAVMRREMRTFLRSERLATLLRGQGLLASRPD